MSALFPTSVVGSLPRPDHVRALLGQPDAGPRLDSAIREAVALQEDAGLDILTDGECGEPAKSRLKRGYVICPGRELYFKAPKRDFVIQMTQKKETV